MKKILIYNTLSRTLERITPIRDSEIGMYSCGLTVYDYAHIGNLRKYLFDDLLKRTLIYFGFKVRHVLNITDVGHLTSDNDTGEDKIEKGAEREHKSAHEIAKFYEDQFKSDLKELNILDPNVMPRATEHIEEQISLLKALEEKGFTYKTSDGIYFDTSRFLDYGKLTRQKQEDLKEGARVEKNPEKKNPTDFALWKFSPEGTRRQMEWNSPWGKGFPGWHLECSAMSTKYLGQPFEIHTGGVDHINVHHTNEIAQSEAAYGKPLAKYWVHSEFLLEDGHKMAKSAGHFIRLQDIKEKGFDPLDFRFLCLQANYRSKLDFSWESLKAARQRRLDFMSFAKLSKTSHTGQDEESFYKSQLGKFEDALADDLNTPKALATISETVSIANVEGFFGVRSREYLERIDNILGLELLQQTKIPESVEEMVREREILRKEGKFEQADELRQKILEAGFVVEDTSKGPKLLTK